MTSILRTGLLCAIAALLAPAAAAGQTTGILLLAHGGSDEWNTRVTDLAAKADASVPTEVAFGMAARATIQAAADRLAARGVTDIVAVPLFVSSWSSIITSTEYLLGLRAEAPKDLALFAAMSHEMPDMRPPAADAQPAAPAAHDHHAADGTTPVSLRVPVRMTAALNDHPIVADILVSRARSVSASPEQEAVVLVAHGPTADDENRRWLADMASLAERMRGSARFASIDVLTLRDDAPAAIRDQATAELRSLVARRNAEGRRVVIVPLLISFGGIDRGLRDRLDGLAYAMPTAGLVPDDRLVTWVLRMAEAR